MSSVKQLQMLSKRIEELERRVVQYERFADKMKDVLRALGVKPGAFARLEMGRSAIIVDPDAITIKGDTIRFEGLNEVDMKAGSGRVTVKKDGTVVVKAKSFDVDASGNVNIKSAGDLRLKGSRILQN